MDISLGFLSWEEASEGKRAWNLDFLVFAIVAETKGGKLEDWFQKALKKKDGKFLVLSLGVWKFEEIF